MTVLFGVSSVLSYSKAEKDRAYDYLRTKWSYHTTNGEKIKVEDVSWKSSGNDYKVIVNGNPLKIEDAFDSDGNNLLNPSIKAKVKWVEPEKKEPSKEPAEVKVKRPEPKGNEPGRLKGFTEAHNEFRRLTGVPDLKWDNRLAAYAKEWADYLKSANNCNMQHRPRSGKYTQKYGENLTWASGKELEPADVVKGWYDEISDYNYADNSCSKACGHYTQVVWKKSTKLGCAMAKCKVKEIWVCNYDPPGNYNGEKPY